MAEAEQGTKWEARKKEGTCGLPKLCTDPEFWGPPRELVSRPSLLFWTRGTLLSVGPNSKSSGGSNQSPVMILFIHPSLPPAGHPIPGAPTMKRAGKSDRQPFPSFPFPCSWYIYPTITGYNLRKYSPLRIDFKYQ